MKKLLFLFLFTFGAVAFAQNSAQGPVKYLKITQKKCLKKSGYQIVLKDIVNDSRCPDGVTCIWAGEASAVVSVYKDSKLVEDNTMVFSMKSMEANKQWFAKYLPVKQRKIQNMTVVPYPKKDEKIDKKDYCIKIGYSK